MTQSTAYFSDYGANNMKCSKCGKDTGDLAVLSPTTEPSEREMCTDCAKKVLTTENQPISTKLVVEPKTLENEGEEPDTLCIEIKASEITIGEQLNIGDMVRMTVTGTVEEIRNSRYWDRIEEEEMSKRKYMIKGNVVNASNTEGHVISVTDPEDDDGGEI